MAELASELTAASETAGPIHSAMSGSSARQLYRQLVWLEVKASAAALIVMLILALFGLDFTLDLVVHLFVHWWLLRLVLREN